MNQETKASMENLLRQMTDFDDETVKAALDRAISGDWATDSKKEKEYSQQLLNWPSL